MKKITSIFISVVTLMSVVLQGQAMYACQSEETVHLSSSCCSTAEPTEESCCSKSEDTQDEFSSKCCSKIEMAFVLNLNNNDVVISNSAHEHFELPFYIEIDASLKGRSISNTNTVSDLSLPPPNKSPSYILFCSFLC